MKCAHLPKLSCIKQTTIMQDIFQNILLGILLAATVGPVTIEMIKRGLKQGFYSAFLLSLGTAAADSTYVLIISFGLSNLINIPTIRILLWLCGALVLLYLGYTNIREYSDKIDLQRSGIRAHKNSFIAGYLMAISNPIAIIWWLGVFGAAIVSTTQNVSSIAAFLSGMTIILGVVLGHFVLSLSLHFGKRFVNESTMRYVSLIAGFTLIGFGLYFGYNGVISLIL